MEDSSIEKLSLSWIVILLTSIVGIFVLWFRQQTASGCKSDDQAFRTSANTPQRSEGQRQKASQQPKTPPPHSRSKITSASPPTDPEPRLLESNSWYLSTVKCTQFTITYVSISGDGKRLIVTASDGFVVFDITNDEDCSLKRRPVGKGAIPGDYFAVADTSVDGEHVFGVTEWGCRLLKMTLQGGNYKQTGGTYEPVHRNSVKWISSSRGPWIVTASTLNDTEIKVFNYSLELVSVVDTKQVKNLFMAFSPTDGRFFAAAAWSPGVKIFEVLQKPDGVATRVTKALDIPTACGTKCGAFSNSNERFVIACKDGSISIWNIAVRYAQQESAKNQSSRTFKWGKDSDGDTIISNIGYTSADKLIIAIAGSTIYVLNSQDLSDVAVIQQAHTVPISSMSISPSYPYFVTCATSQQVRLWRVPLETRSSLS